MITPGTKALRRLVVWVVAILGHSVGVAVLDRNDNGMSDVWEQIHAAALVSYGDPEDDPDGDGFTNEQESMAWTDPGDDYSGPFVDLTYTLISWGAEPDLDVYEVEISWWGVLHAWYAVETSETEGEYWDPWKGPFLGQGGTLAVTYTTIYAELGEVLFRVVALPADDTDGDGLNDLEEEALGTGRFSVDSDSDGIPDLWEVIHADWSGTAGIGGFSGSGMNPLDDSDANTDLDNDGLSNGVEYLAGTDPLDDGDPSSWDPPLDTDGDGLPDAVETALGTDPEHPDTDGDGRSDYEEVLLGTDPNDADDTVPTLLDAWDFESGLVSMNGNAPSSSSGVNSVDSWSGDGVLVNWTSGAILRYPVYRSDGRASFSAWSGTVRMWVKPEWTSTSLGGSGPGTYGRIFEYGYYTSPLSHPHFVVSLLPDGDKIAIDWKSATTGYGSGWIPIEWREDVWYHVVLTWGEGKVALHVDGEVVAQITGIASGDRFTTPANASFQLLSDHYWSNNPGVVGDRVVIWNRPWTAPEIAADLAAEWAIDTDEDGLPDVWEHSHFGNLSHDGNDDPDSDGLSNAREYAIGTRPDLADTDGDSINDGTEIANGTSPLDPENGDDWTDLTRVRLVLPVMGEHDAFAPGFRLIPVD